MALVLTLLSGCAEDSNGSSALSADNVNLIFVVSPDLAYQTPGDIDPDTANLTDQGLQRSLLMATYLRTRVLGTSNVTRISVLQPMTHLQTVHQYPDMTAIGFIQQFALLNQVTLPVDINGTRYTANSYPIDAAYASGSVPVGGFIPAAYCPDCQGLDFKNAGGNNDALADGIIKAAIPGSYVFSAPWETIEALLTGINLQQSYNLNIPATYVGSNRVYAISIPPAGAARLVTYDSNLNPPSTYPALPPVAAAPCTHLQQELFITSRTGGVDGAVIPPGINKNEIVYIVRHAEAHPGNVLNAAGGLFEDGNYVGAGQWRALDLPNALRGKISPDEVYSIDPAQWFPIPGGHDNVSYVRPSLTVLPYAIANRLPYYLTANFSIGDPTVAQLASNFFFTDGALSGHVVLLAWESSRINPLINALLQSYGGGNLPLIPPTWPVADYDTMWTVTLDAGSNVTVDNILCEGIDSAQLPATAPSF